MEFKIDCHIHSKFSGDYFLRKITPELILDRAISRGLDGVAITDAREDRAFDAACTACKRAEDNQYDIKMLDCNGGIALFEQNGREIYLLRGIEHHDDKGHLLEIGGKAPIKYNPKYSLNERAKCAIDNGNLIGAAHPYEVGYGGMGGEQLEKITYWLDFVEVFNSLAKRKANKRALETSKELWLPGLSNSDDHNAKPGRAYTILDIQPKGQIVTSKDIIDSIAAGKIVGHHQEYTSFLEKLWIFAGKDFAGLNFGPALERIGRGFRR